MTPCVEWPQVRRADGRAVAGRSDYAYRVAWEAVHGPLPTGMVIHHLCSIPSCVRLTHLEVMTQAEHAAVHLSERNRQRGAERTHCKNGHPLEGDNVRTVESSRDGTYRRCRTCERAAKARFRSRQAVRSW